jgi:hypothetical protein
VAVPLRNIQAQGLQPLPLLHQYHPTHQKLEEAEHRGATSFERFKDFCRCLGFVLGNASGESGGTTAFSGNPQTTINVYQGCTPELTAGVGFRRVFFPLCCLLHAGVNQDTISDVAKHLTQRRTHPCPSTHPSPSKGGEGIQRRKGNFSHAFRGLSSRHSDFACLPRLRRRQAEGRPVCVANATGRQVRRADELPIYSESGFNPTPY